MIGKDFTHEKKLLPALIVTGLIILVVIIMGITALINKYTPTKRQRILKSISISLLMMRLLSL